MSKALIEILHVKSNLQGQGISIMEDQFEDPWFRDWFGGFMWMVKVLGPKCPFSRTNSFFFERLVFYFFKPKINQKTTRTVCWDTNEPSTFSFRSLSPPFHTKQTHKARWPRFGWKLFWFAHSGHDPLLVALAYSCRDGNKGNFQKMKLPSHFLWKKKTRRIQIWRSETLGHPTLAWKASADSGHRWHKFTVTSCWAIAVAKCGEKHVWTYGGTARSTQNSQDNLLGLHHVQILLKMHCSKLYQTWVTSQWFLFWTKHSRSFPKFVIISEAFWLLPPNTV